MSNERIPVEIACALAERQAVIPLEVATSCTAEQALLQSGIFSLFPEIDPARCAIGIFGREVARDRRLCAGDRVEVLRPLLEDPRERRRRRASQGRSIGRR